MTLAQLEAGTQALLARQGITLTSSAGEIVVQAAQPAPQFDPDLGVERAEGFVEQHSKATKFVRKNPKKAAEDAAAVMQVCAVWPASPEDTARFHATYLVSGTATYPPRFEHFEHCVGHHRVMNRLV